MAYELIWVANSMDKFISCVVPGPSYWFFHFGEEIIIAWTQKKMMTLGGTEPHHSSWQCKESHRCYHGPLVPLAMGDSETTTILTRYETMWLRNHFAKVKEPLQGTQYNTRVELIHAQDGQYGTSTKMDIELKENNSILDRDLNPLF